MAPVVYMGSDLDEPLDRHYTPEAVRSCSRACLLGGAIGDALGAPIEFLTLTQIHKRYGAKGVTDFVAGDWPAGTITDDTQMTLFTAEGLIRGKMRWLDRGIASAESVVYQAYLRWLMTQGIQPPNRDRHDASGFLISVPELHARRAPGNTCLSALQSIVEYRGKPASNSSKGCGAVMRMAPVGLVDPRNPPGPWAIGAGNWSFTMGRDFAAITHGHPSGQLAAGAFAVIVGALANGTPLTAAIKVARHQLIRHESHEETLAAINAAVKAAAKGTASAITVEQLGRGWVAEEALSIGIYCALVAKTFEEGVLLAVNHGGDSDSTGSIAGNLLGIIHGESALPAKWLKRLELRRLIARIAEDLVDCPHFRSIDATSRDRYFELRHEAYPPN